MSATLQGSGHFQVPEVSQEDISSFHDAHFSFAAVELFDTQFLQPENTQDDNQYYEEYEEYYEEEDDGLGYYPDGVKRTLTDEQIAIFRHSEIEALRRAKRRAAKLGETSIAPLQVHEDDSISTGGPNPDSIAIILPTIPDEGQEEHKGKRGDLQDGSEDGEIEEEKPAPTEAEIKRQKKQRARKRKQEQRKFQPEKKPDLRKRTWDVVEAGMDSLYYDDETAQDTTAAPAAQRRRISYDD
ncbi:uncharacterized protein F4812DRAFT_461787 [Daldinia caldariorum]|uniref:uncharacterized protein n=1 Tax=Daldinia caldariorum TaxID=326644 RepID=UPI0020073860|nr:uncharacterized protein F4812DRAFT_461787 [Daldinia caldariorum]KAI1465478.1 hypothetical protein F4812DRAFT_461787 [Daldinia caldariorum]